MPESNNKFRLFHNDFSFLFFGEVYHFLLVHEMKSCFDTLTKYFEQENLQGIAFLFRFSLKNFKILKTVKKLRNV